ncbi:MAG TPA: divalent metal cation transporter [Candidatus Dormibacteraeota bacterium]|jgi:NRAMP (natural resistance-associated macrophage protein)-like metal ion transporter|nr:divalent metal cation transporter [Candidatus Dormibacteraeota bacterium]
MARSAEAPRRRAADPIRAVLPGASTADPPKEELLKPMPEGHGASGTPAAGRSTVEHARARGPRGVLQVLGPGLITGASDDDPSGIGTYSQVGAQLGYGLLWMALFTFPLMTAVQEMCARIALQTGQGLGVSLRRRFPTWLVGSAVLALVVANVINVGADLGAVAAGAGLLIPGVPSMVFVVVAAALVLGLQLFSTYARLVSAFKWLTLALFAYVISLFLAHPDMRGLVTGALVPHLELNATWITAIVAILGTTISPYLFFWQASSEVDELRATGRDRRRLKDRELRAARVDVGAGMAFSQVVMFCIIASTAAVLHAHGKTDVQTAQQAASALEPIAGRFASLLFAAGLIGTGLLAVPVLTGSAAYAIREVAGFGGGLGLKPRYRPTFYGIIAVATIVGVLLNVVGFDPIHALFITAVINGVVAPPLLVLITMVAGDRKIMGDRVSRRLSRTLSWAAAVVMSVAAVALLVTLVPH